MWEAHDAFDQAHQALAHERWDVVAAQLGRLALFVGEHYGVSFRLAEAEARLGHWAAAQAQMARALDALSKSSFDSPDQLRARTWHASLCLRSGNQPAYRSACKRMLDGVGTRPTPRAAFFALWHCTLASGAVDDPEVLVRMAQASLGTESAEPNPSLLAAAGAALYRAGRYREAIGMLESAERLQSGVRPQIQAFLAMANHALGHAVEARRWLEQVHARTAPSGSDPDLFWSDIEIETLYHQAEALLLFDPVFPAEPFAR